MTEGERFCRWFQSLRPRDQQYLRAEWKAWGYGLMYGLPLSLLLVAVFAWLA